MCTGHFLCLLFIVCVLRCTYICLEISITQSMGSWVKDAYLKSVAVGKNGSQNGDYLAVVFIWMWSLARFKGHSLSAALCSWYSRSSEQCCDANLVCLTLGICFDIVSMKWLLECEGINWCDTYMACVTTLHTCKKTAVQFSFIKHCSYLCIKLRVLCTFIT